MDLSKFSTEDLQALRNRDLSKVSTEGLQMLRGQMASGQEAQTDTAPTPSSQDIVSKAKEYGLGTLGALGKAAGTIRAATTGPLTGAILEKISGKPVFSAQDEINAFNPTNLKTFPSNSEMFKRAGISNPSLSDALPSLYAKPGSEHPWYQPEKGGWFDPTLAGALEVGTDPSMYLGAGETGAAAKAIRATSPTARAIDTLSMAKYASPGKWVASGLEMVPGVDKVANTLANPLSAFTRGTGRTTYGATLRPVEHEGERLGKGDVVKAMKDAGVWQPFGIEGKTQAAADTLMDARSQLMQEAADKGATVNMRDALSPGYAEARRLRTLGQPEADRIADELERQLDHTVQISEGVPSTPGRPAQYGTREVPIEGKGGTLMDEFGQEPLTKTETVQVAPEIPGSPGVPAQPYTPQRASDLKSFMTETLPRSTFNATLATPVGARGIRNAASGLKTGVENAVEKATGKGADLQDLNKNLGALIGTKKSQMRVGMKADTDLDNIVRGTGMDAVVGGIAGGVSGSPMDAAKAILIKKAVRGVQLGTMPTGYVLQKLGEANVLDRLNQLVQEQKRGNNGQKSSGR